MLVASPVLALFNLNLETILSADASSHGLGAVLTTFLTLSRSNNTVIRCFLRVHPSIIERALVAKMTNFCIASWQKALVGIILLHSVTCILECFVDAFCIQER